MFLYLKLCQMFLYLKLRQMFLYLPFILVLCTCVLIAALEGDSPKGVAGALLTAVGILHGEVPVAYNHQADSY